MIESSIVINEGTTFMVTDSRGNVPNGTPLGLFKSDTRYLNLYLLRVNGQELLPISHTRKGYIARVSLINPAISADGRMVPEGSLRILRTMSISTNFYETISIKNTNDFPVKLEISLSFDADFLDIFEVKGISALKKGMRAIIKGEEGKNAILLRYKGFDRVIRRTELVFRPTPEIRRDTANFNLEMAPYGTKEINVEAIMTMGSVPIIRQEYAEARKESEASYDRWQRGLTRISTDSEPMNNAIDTCIMDLRSLIINTKEGLLVPAAGIPWFDTIFGRDSLITSFQTLMLNPGLSASTLRYLTLYQGAGVDTVTEGQPGKILHEIRGGELASLYHTQYKPYYGSIDSTPLYLILLSEYHKWTGDDTLISALKPGAEAAARWIDDYGDIDKDGFIEYFHRPDQARLISLDNQGWKDSNDSIVFSDGKLAEPPIALSEVQGYAYDARRRFAALYPGSGVGKRMDAGSVPLKEKYNREFWMPEKEFFAEALDRDKRQVDSITSNPCRGLWSEIIEPVKARKLVGRIFQEDMYSGWGIRTLASSERAYGPRSYHNGPIWPHDNSIIAWGLKKYGYTEEANRIITSLIDACKYFDYRLPELFCGYPRRKGHAPVIYHSTCSPEAWASGSIMLFLQTMLGLYPDAPGGVLYVKPSLPEWINRVTLKNMVVGGERVSIEFKKVKGVTTFDIIGKKGRVRVEPL
jgi:glycogen debranching enzyme